MKNIEEACEIMHDAYEKAAVGAGWETNPASRKPWADVPEANKATMRAAVAALLASIESDNERIFRKGMERGFINAKAAVETMQADAPFNAHEVVWAINATKTNLLSMTFSLSEPYVETVAARGSVRNAE